MSLRLANGANDHGATHRKFASAASRLDCSGVLRHTSRRLQRPHHCENYSRMPADCSADAAPLATQKRGKIRLTTKARLLSLSDLDHRTRAAQNCARLITGLQADCGPDPGHGRLELAKRAAGYTATVNALRRVLQALDIARDPKVIDGTTQSTLDAQSHVWPQFRAAEAARSAQAAAHMATLIERLGDDEPLKSDGDDSVPPTREDLQP